MPRRYSGVKRKPKPSARGAVPRTPTTFMLRGTGPRGASATGFTPGAGYGGLKGRQRRYPVIPVTD
jgi:hypothetical protein